jgi:predicted dinucleotide-binding enzyme
VEAFIESLGLRPLDVGGLKTAQPMILDSGLSRQAV